MVIIDPRIRPANFKDNQQLSNLIFFESRLHRHMDWRSPLELLGAPFYWALEEGGQVIAALACSPEAKGINWVRLFVYAGRWDAAHAWRMLWATTREEISRSGGATVAAIAMQPWFQQILAASGFSNFQHIVMLEWRGFASQLRARDEMNGIRIRKMTEADLHEVEKTDAASFVPLWQIPLDTLRRAFSQTLLATVAEDDHGIVGYQLTTGGRTHAHLARLAVHPSAQGRGAGRALLIELFARLMQMGVPRLTVNTQSDNEASLGLYQKMGFMRTGEQYPVYTFEIPSLPEEDK
jgi:ribosomal protein S18 acetylase RimI-like enzyme